MDTVRWQQGIGLLNPMEGSSAITDQRRPRPQQEQALNCPRCNSANTKFCYYNNYSLSQPRFFCKTCRRYWTEGGSLRNVPVGGGSRKNKRSSSSSPASSKKFPDPTTPPSFSQKPKIHEGHDLNLAYTPPTSSDYNNINNPTLSSSSSNLSAMDLLRTGIASRPFGFFMPISVVDANTIYTSGFLPQEFKPSLNFSIDGYGSLQGVQETSARLFLPFENLKQPPNTAEFEQNRGQGESSGYWSGMLGGGSW